MIKFENILGELVKASPQFREYFEQEYKAVPISFIARTDWEDVFRDQLNVSFGPTAGVRGTATMII